MGILNRIKKTTKETDSNDLVDKEVHTDQKKSIPEFGLSSFVDVIIKPILSEKASVLASTNQYVFLVRKEANRIQVSSAIKHTYGMKPVSVNILNIDGKKLRFGGRKGKRSDWKKAIVTIPEGQTINVYEGV
ncbi:MAG: 50S ribosomal protein L23 [Candidatus Uhrbacteria bacterium GW2011_GWF2_39_13]|uniref:Large ribosomal subunit protein uL23 n=1 Tax=Candidatus Uhrbacteria bacterium GW2011_GWF2_39_13 TaxID=1618995 RepID=A0A0G0MKV8_9BACT|nr:MAG: 50S ribosomal protein L23 [Candidatus Uhrbacteria bacterium GW2011_GWF2_39_13]